MIVYQATKAGFSEDVLEDRIETKVLEYFKRQLNRSTSRSEFSSWRESMQYMDRVLNHASIPEDCGVAIEYQIPQSAKRLDFILTGTGEDQSEYAILIELKRWSEASLSHKDGIVNTYVNKGIKELVHPSFQAWSYASLLKNFNQTIEENQIYLHPCAYLHNYIPDEVIKHDHYREYIERAPVFLKGDALKLREFIRQYIKYGDNTRILYRIEHGQIRPSKMLADSMVKMLNGNQAFIMIDDQKLVFETALELTQKASGSKKQVLIVKGGPGTGKSVVAVNLLVELSKRRLLTQYVSKNAAPRAVYENKLTGNFKKSVISNLFRGSGGFVDTQPDLFDCLIVDEAHRLNERSGLYSNLGENQVKELIRASRCTIFFIDEDQRVTLNDIGTIAEIKKWADRANTEIEVMELSSQFRCNGADGYLAWLDHSFQIRETTNTTLRDINYDFQIFSSPVDLRNAIVEKNANDNKSRIVAGYCWEWKSKKDPAAFDIVLPEFDFVMRWNLSIDGSLWIVGEQSIHEAGCIHTCQGLELDYVGVIVGPDLIVRNGKVLTQPAARAKGDKSVFGYKKLLEKSPEEGKATLRAIIKNTYRTLMTRGMKGCYVYFTDKETEAYFRNIV